MNVSVSKGEIVIRSRILNKRIIPRLTNAHNYDISTVPAYRFLASIQHQQSIGLALNVSQLERTRRFLPRISYKSIIFRRAIWILRQVDIGVVDSSANTIFSLRCFFEEWHVPQYVAIVEGDNELFIDIKNESYLDLLLSKLKSRSKLILVEWLHCAGFNSLSNDRFVNQFVLPLERKSNDQIIPCSRNADVVDNSYQSYAPGAEWLYFKIYCSAIISDMILLKNIQPICSFLLENGII